MIWSNHYIGTPFREFGRDADGVDCWGLCCLVYDRELGIDLPHYLDYSSASERQEVDQLMRVGRTGSDWCLVRHHRPLDLALFTIGGLISHVGIVVDQSRMLHVAGEDAAKIERYTAPRWHSRLVGTYRHREAIT